MQKPAFRSYTFHLNSKKSRKMVIIIACFVASVFVILGLWANRYVSLKKLKNQQQVLTASTDITSAMFADTKGSGYGHTESIHQTFLSYLLYLITDINFQDVSSLLSWQIPMMNVSQVQLISGNPMDTKQFAYSPPNETIPSAKISQTIGNPPVGSLQTAKDTLPKQGDNNPQVYIYHTHNREAYLPELKGVTEVDDAYDAKINITRYGEKLKEELKQLGVSAIQTTDDYWTLGPYWNDYKYSRVTVKNVLNKYPGLKMILDVHRDSEPKSITTTTVNGQSTAGIYLIIGGMNPRHAENEKLANALKNQMDKLYPGLSRGIWRKTSTQYDTIYNQDLSPNSVLVEIGGPDNTQDELNRAVDDFARVIAQVLKQTK